MAVIEGDAGSHLHTSVHSNDRIAVLAEIASSDPKSLQGHRVRRTTSACRWRR
nr:hypothetical protein [Deltaproteobacteria bacterium]